MRLIEQRLIDEIEAKYNPDHDIPVAPEVTWTDSYLLRIIQAQQAQIEGLRKELDAVKYRINEAYPMAGLK